ncbi:MAG: TonB-dependent receptor [Bacteroidota bacterium]
MRALLLLLVALLATPLSLAQTDPTVVTGRVIDGAGMPLPLVNVALVGTIDGTATDDAGRFDFGTRQQGDATLGASLIGFEPVEVPVTLVPGDTVRVDFRMRETLVTLGEVSIEGSAFRAGDAPTATLSALEVVTTPGAAADVYRALQAFPGVTMVDEGSGLFVRGGDVGETAILLDGAVLQHPYRYESATGGIFGTIPPFFLKDTYFSAGGFSARHGDALSGVVALETLDEPQQSSVTLNAGLAGAALGVNARLLDGKLGVRFSGNRSATGLLMAVNRLDTDFEETPGAYDTNLSVAYRYRPSGVVKFFSYRTENRVGARTPQPSFDGVYRATEENLLNVLRWQDVFGDWFLQGSLSATTFTSASSLGNLDLATDDTVLGGRFDAERSVTEKLRVATGAEVRRFAGRFRGAIPTESDVLDPDAATTSIDERANAVRTGGYALAEAQLSRRLFANVGLRTDYHTEAQQAVLDPRAALRLQLTEDAHLHVAGGRYSQFPSPEQFDSNSGGSADLGAQQAVHLIAGGEYQRKHLRLRVEGYWKQYDNLLVRVPDANSEFGTRWANDGTGLARGIDVFAQYGAFLRTRFNGWLSYSLLRSERTQTRWQGDTATLDDGPAPFDVTHHLTAVGKVRMWRFLTVGTTLRLATGRPHTPILDAQQAAPMSTGGGYFLPVEGPVGSERLPTFSRVDFSASWYQPFGNGHGATFYVSLANALGQRNVLGYDYSADYATRTARRSDYDRFVYAGVTLELVRR